MRKLIAKILCALFWALWPAGCGEMPEGDTDQATCWYRSSVVERCTSTGYPVSVERCVSCDVYSRCTAVDGDGCWDDDDLVRCLAEKPTTQRTGC